MHLVYRLVFKILIVLSFTLVICCVNAETAPQFIGSERFHIIKDDGTDRSIPSDELSAWREFPFQGLPLSERNMWIQVEFDIQQTPSAALGVLINISGAFDAYFDGEFIGSSGQVADDKMSEQPSLVDRIMLLPTQSSTLGKHYLNLRVSAHYNPKDTQFGSFTTALADYDYLLQVPYKHASRPLIMSSALALVFIYSLTLFFVGYRDFSYLIFAALSVSILILMFTESWRGIWPYPYHWQTIRLQIVLGLSCIIGMLLNAFYLWFFTFSARLRTAMFVVIALSQLAFIVAIDSYDIRSLYVFACGLFASFLVCTLALFHKQKYALLMISGLAIFVAPVVINRFAYMDYYFFVSFSALIALMLYTLAQTMQSKQRALAKSQINASRLELELLKRNLQPHFILNTLTAIEEWIEDNPKTAVRFIQALADEFRCMAKMSSKTIIALQDEIELCEAHLSVMSYRTNIEFTLEQKLVSTESALPPGILLTLIENAISHNNYSQGKITFTLTQTFTVDEQILALTTPVMAKASSNSIHQGIGSKYIHARLRESFNDEWSINEDLGEKICTVSVHLPRDTAEQEGKAQSVDKDVYV